MLLYATIIDRLWQTWAFLTTSKVLAIVGGIGFALLALFLFVASRTRWGHSKPLTKCVVLSILAHIWLLMYALGHRTILPQGDPYGDEQAVVIDFDEDPSPELSAVTEQQPINPLDALTPLADLPNLPELASGEAIQWDDPPKLLAVVPSPLPEIPAELLDSLRSDGPAVEADAMRSDIEASKIEAGPTGAQPTHSTILPPPTSTASATVNDYQMRQQTNRLELVRAYGADEDTEAAVEAALRWLAGAQSDDGGWNAANYQAGTETRALGEYRHKTGDRADTGVTGLALLAFLSAGHTHLDGPYRHHVESGLNFLLRSQMPSGDLSGPKQIGNEPSVVNARMYCHSIAMLSLAEAYAMTQDQAIREGLLRAAQFTIAAQDVRGGGWRYRPGDPGDLSLFGWKAMALRSVARSGIDVSNQVEQRMRRFLDSCATGQGGLARYRPGEGRASETMTAEALACRLLLQYPLSNENRREATQMIMSNLPGATPDNVYYWYYATLALFQLQDENWRIWNQALKAQLLKTQQPTYGDQPGSWNPDGIWGGYGGRIYSTAISCLCLEVYYRYLPMYQRTTVANSSSPKNSPN